MFIACVTAFALLIAVIALLRATPLYTATTQVLLEQREKLPALEAPVSYDSRFDLSYMDNQLAILQSDSLLRRVVIKERLAPNTKESQAAAPHSDAPASPEGAIRDGINRLRGALAVSRGGSSGSVSYSRILKIAVTWEDSGPSGPAR